MTFPEKFGDIVCEGDTIVCTCDGFQLTARIVYDDCSEPPDARQDGFWPSLDIGDPGFIGPGKNPRQRLKAAQKKSEIILQTWKQDEWFYCRIILSVACDGIELERHAASLFGLEANYPGANNTNLGDVAAQLVPDAVEVGRAVLQRLFASELAKQALS